MEIKGLTIEQFISNETKPKTVVFWGSEYSFTPVICSKILGDGLQVVYLSSINQRPHYWLMRIDSSTDVEQEDFDYESEILNHIEAKFGSCDEDYEDDEDDEGDNEGASYPIVNWGGGGWGTVANFATGFYEAI